MNLCCLSVDFCYLVSQPVKAKGYREAGFRMSRTQAGVRRCSSWLVLRQVDAHKHPVTDLLTHGHTHQLVVVGSPCCLGELIVAQRLGTASPRFSDSLGTSWDVCEAFAKVPVVPCDPCSALWPRAEAGGTWLGSARLGQTVHGAMTAEWHWQKWSTGFRVMSGSQVPSVGTHRKRLATGGVEMTRKDGE